MTKIMDAETGKVYTCCSEREYEEWTDDCGGRFCTLRKISWNEWAGEDACSYCPFVCEGDWD